jgi:transporter family protein
MNRSGLLYALLAAVLWGIAPVFEKLGLIHISPLAGLVIRTVSATVILILIMLFTNVHTEILRADARTIGFLVLSGMVAGLLGMWSYFSAMKYWEASRVVPIVGAYPLFAFLFSLLLLGEQLTLQKGIGVILIVGGVILLG